MYRLLVCLTILAFLSITPFAAAESITAITPDTVSQLEIMTWFSVEDEALQFLWTPDSAALVVLTAQHVIQYNLFLPEIAPLILAETAGRFTALAFSDDFRAMALASTDPSVENIDIQSGLVLARLPLEVDVRALDFTADGKHLIVVDGASYDFSVWDVTTANRVAAYETDQPGTGLMLDAVFSPDASLLALGSGGGFNRVTLWDTATGSRVYDAYGNAAGLTFSWDNRWLAGWSRYGGFGEVIDVETGERVQAFDRACHYARAADFSADGALYAAVMEPCIQSGEAALVFWDTPTGEVVRTLPLWDAASGQRLAVYLAFSPDGRMIAVYDSVDGFRLWAVPQGSN